MDNVAEALIKKAKDHGLKPSEPELELLRKIAVGKVADFCSGVMGQDRPELANQWDKNRCISAELIVWLLTARDVKECITYRGVEVMGARIEGPLNLNWVSLDYPLAFRVCAFTGTISLENASLKFLDLSGSDISPHQLSSGSNNGSPIALAAKGLQVSGDILLNSMFRANGKVSIAGGAIGGNLLCDKSSFLNQGDDALCAQNASIKGNVLLTNIVVNGRVWLSLAAIGGNLHCEYSQFTFESIERDSSTNIGVLLAQNIEVQGNVFFSNNFSANGGVRLDGAKIGGNLQCDDTSQFLNQSGDALSAQNSDIKGSVFLNKGFKAVGAVSFLGSWIGGNINCDNSSFENTNSVALMLQGSEIKGSVSLLENFKAVGEVSLSGVSIGGNLQCDGGSFTNHNGYALLIQNGEIQASVFLEEGFRAEGQVLLFGTKIGGNLRCNDASFRCESNRQEKTDVFALALISTEVGNNVVLGENCNLSGKVGFINSIARNNFVLYFKNSEAIDLDLRFSSVGVLHDLEVSWPKEGSLWLDDFKYESISLDSPHSSNKRLEWIRRQTKSNFSPQPYEQTALVLQANGHKQSATEILIGKHEDLRKYGDLNRIGKTWNWLLGKTIAHGYKPHRALWQSLVIIVFGTFLFHLGYISNIIEPSDLEAYSISIQNDGSLSKPLTKLSSPAYPEFFTPVYSLDVFLPIIDFHQESFWLPKASKGRDLLEVPYLMLKVKTGGLLLAYFWLHIFLGWIFTSLWVAGFTGIVRQIE